jgi:Domain of unknown function (DUF4157)
MVGSYQMSFESLHQMKTRMSDSVNSAASRSAAHQHRKPADFDLAINKLAPDSADSVWRSISNRPLQHPMEQHSKPVAVVGSNGTRAESVTGNSKRIDMDVNKASVARVGGSTLPFGIQHEMESQFGESFHNVRIHEGIGSLESKNVLAMTQGTDVHFAHGYGSDNRFLFAHELTHVVQQRRGAGRVQGSDGHIQEKALEAEADHVGHSIAIGKPAGPIHGRAKSLPLHFTASEHRDMGDKGSNGKTVMLAPDCSITYGQMTALAGDHFESIQQMREFAGRGYTGPESRDEIEYALEWQLGVTGRKHSAGKTWEEAKKAQEQRYYTLAGRNDTHFPNPNAGDMGRSTASKALDIDSLKTNRWWPKGKPKNAIAAYRMNHVQAINEALTASKIGAPIDSAMAVDAFGSHYLTDSFSSGHIRTERSAIREYWNSQVPLFYFNFTGYLAEKIAEQITGWRSIFNEETRVKGARAGRLPRKREKGNWRQGTLRFWRYRSGCAT